MSELGVQLLWAALQVTLLALLVIVFVGFGARGRPAGSATLTAVGFAAAIGLTLAALCPLPAWWTWVRPPDSATAVHDAPLPAQEQGDTGKAERAEAETDGTSQSGSSFRLPLSLVERAWHSAVHVARPAQERSWPWPMVVTILFGIGSAWCLARLALGWWSVRRLWQRSRPIADPNVQRRLTTLCEEMGCRRSLAVRESAELSTAATTGWLRPRVLLPADWRDWPAEELTAVLAHELAHICRADYAAWLTAQFCVALHFYHPLVHYLVRRLHLHQELAADALGASFAGGRGDYLRALARLALRQDDRPLRGPARAFLPARGTLMRRIAMLRDGTRIESKPPSRRSRMLLMGCLCLAGLGLSALRGPAQDPAAQSPDAAPKGASGETDGGTVLLGGAKRLAASRARPPFIFARQVPDAAGIVALRPAEIFCSPDMKKIAALWEKEARQALKEYGLADAIPSLGQIEQITGVIQLSNNPKAPKGNRHSLAVSLPLVRTTGDYDWSTLIDKFRKSEKLLKLLCEKAEEVRFEGKVYYRLVNCPALAGQVVGKKMTSFDVCVGLLDKHTLVLDDEESVKKLFREGTTSLPDWVEQTGWQSVANGLVAVAVDNRKKIMDAEFDEDDKHLAGLKTVFEKMTALVFGIDATPDNTTVSALGTFTDDQAAEEAAKALKGVLAAGSLAVDLLRRQPHDPEPMERWGQEFLHHAKIERRANAAGKQTILHVHSDANLDMKELLDFINSAEGDKKK